MNEQEFAPDNSSASKLNKSQIIGGFLFITDQQFAKTIVVGRKNWLFSNTAKGAESSAIVYTLVETAKANGLVPHAYLFGSWRNSLTWAVIPAK